MKLKPFTKAEHDGFAGAENFSTGHAPLFHEGHLSNGKSFIITFAGNGSTLVILGDKQSEYGGYVLDMQFPAAAAARAFAAGMGSPKTLADFKKFGYKEA